MNKARRNAARKRRAINRTLAPLMRAESYFATMRDNTARMLETFGDGVERTGRGFEKLRETVSKLGEAFPAELTMRFESKGK